MPPKKGRKLGVKLSSKFPKAPYKKQKTPPPEESDEDVQQDIEEDSEDTEYSVIFDKKVGGVEKHSKTQKPVRTSPAVEASQPSASQPSAEPPAQPDPPAQLAVEPPPQPAQPPAQQQSSGGGKGKGKSKGKSKATVSSVTVSRTDSQESLECDEDDDSDGDEQDDEDGDQKSKKKRKITGPPVMLTTEQEMEMVMWIQANPMLYDKSKTEYRYTQKKNEMWQEQAARLDLTVQQIKKWYSTQRTRYGRLGNTKSGQATPKFTDREKWLQESFGFLGTHIYRQPTRQACSVSEIYFVCHCKFCNFPETALNWAKKKTCSIEIWIF